MKTIHYIDELSTKSIKRNGIDSATHSSEQHTFCGLTIKVEKRSEFATSINGRGAVTCDDCINKLKERDAIPFDCERCKEILDINDTVALRNTDEERLCIKCKE